MIDREMRDKAATLLRQLAAAEITNDDFHDAFPRSREDWAIEAIFWMAWAHYSDLHNHRLVGKYALDEEGRKLFRRAETFLRSGLEYGYPKKEFSKLGRPNPLMVVITLGLEWFLYRRRRRHDEGLLREHEAVGDMDVWPFLSREDYEAEKANAS
ncbi:MAG: hypothetical protein Q7V31_08460 [Parvibaculum sp.]|uniref:hypothetical protein n=1 Tax=Parvibaculum sp. TaxID=2024848 RepID=UPI0027222280|nr:hypothetical protein [Parvibaculum sp.]MDO8838950.1 hypothetical protein [Parvibaculum sp.]